MLKSLINHGSRTKIRTGSIIGTSVRIKQLHYSRLQQQQQYVDPSKPIQLPPGKPTESKDSGNDSGKESESGKVKLEDGDRF